MRKLIQFIFPGKILFFLVLKSSGQIVNEKVNYIPVFDHKVIRVINAIIGLKAGAIAGGILGISSGLGNFQKYDWRKGGSSKLNLKSVRKHHACGYIIPYHLSKGIAENSVWKH